MKSLEWLCNPYFPTQYSPGHAESEIGSCPIELGIKGIYVADKKWKKTFVSSSPAQSGLSFFELISTATSICSSIVNQIPLTAVISLVAISEPRRQHVSSADLLSSIFTTANKPSQFYAVLMSPYLSKSQKYRGDRVISSAIFERMVYSYRA